MKSDLLHVVEAAQSLETGDDAWMNGVTEAMGPLLDGGHGVYGHHLDASDPGRLRLGPIFAYRGSRDQVRAVRETNASIPPDVVDRTYRAAIPLATASECVGAKRWREIVAGQVPSRIRDFVCVTAIDARGVGCAIGAPLERVVRYPAAAKGAWSRVVAHVVAMRRLRVVLADGAGRADGEAVLSPDARVCHAEGAARGASARAALREAALRRERARGAIRREDDRAALGLWPALAAGRWSIVDRFDRDGRRFMIAHENRPPAVGPRALSPRERRIAELVAMGKSNKLVAYELGLSPNSIGSHLHAALRKLGLRSRLDLVRILRAAWMAGSG